MIYIKKEWIEGLLPENILKIIPPIIKVECDKSKIEWVILALVAPDITEYDIKMINQFINEWKGMIDEVYFKCVSNKLILIFKNRAGGLREVSFYPIRERKENLTRNEFEKFIAIYNDVMVQMRLEEAEQKIRNLEEELSSVRQENEELRKRLEELEAGKRRLEEELGRLREAARAAAEEIREARSRLEEAEKKLLLQPPHVE